MPSPSDAQRIFRFSPRTLQRRLQNPRLYCFGSLYPASSDSSTVELCRIVFSTSILISSSCRQSTLGADGVVSPNRASLVPHPPT